MKVSEIINEAAMKSLQGVIDDAEKKAFDDASESKSAVSGDAVMKHMKKALKKHHQGDVPGYLSAMRAASAHVKKEYGKGNNMKVDEIFNEGSERAKELETALRHMRKRYEVAYGKQDVESRKKRAKVAAKHARRHQHLNKEVLAKQETNKETL